MDYLEGLHLEHARDRLVRKSLKVRPVSISPFTKDRLADNCKVLRALSNMLRPTQRVYCNPKSELARFRRPRGGLRDIGFYR